MLKKAFLRGLIGFPIGVTIGDVISFLASTAYGQGKYAAVVPAMAAECGSEMTAVWVQFLLCGLMGAVFAAMSVVWEHEKMNLAAKSAINFVISVCTMIPISYVCHWMEHSLVGALQYVGIFAGIYLSIWATMYCVYRSHINQINRKVDAQEDASR